MSTDDNSIAWGSYENLARILANNAKCGKSCDSLFAEQILATNKINGSNLAIEICKADGAWSVIALHGRNVPLWTAESGILFSKSGKAYGNFGSIGELPLEMFKIASRFADSIRVDYIVMYGEAFRSKKQEKASWHPFGYKIRDKDGNLILQHLTPQVHAHISSICQTPNFSSHDDMIGFLEATNVHVAFPPPIYFVGALGDCINYLFPIFMQLHETFEGVFIVAIDGSFGMKFKTGILEEQPAIPDVSTLNFTDPASIEIYSKITAVFASKITAVFASKSLKKVVATSEKESSTDHKPVRAVDPLVTKIEEAFDNIASKEAGFAEVPKKDRKPIVDRFVPLVVNELVSHFTKADMVIPWDKDVIMKKAKTIVTQKVMSA